MTVDRLRTLSPAELGALHETGVCPAPEELLGTLDGEVLDTTLLRVLHPWKGKVVERDDTGIIGGRNRIGVGPLEIRRFRFTALVGRSLFGDRDVLLLDHDHAGNPAWVRRFHDELVRIEDGLYLATSHHGQAGELRRVAYFALRS